MNRPNTDWDRIITDNVKVKPPKRLPNTEHDKIIIDERKKHASTSEQNKRTN